MTSNYLQNSAAPPRPVADRLLMLLKTRGPQSATDLGTALGMTREAARQQLVKLATSGLVEARSEACGVGRPRQLWRLTAAGNDRFPDTHAELTVQLIRMVRIELGEAALDRLIAAREGELRAAYAAELAGATDLRERVARLAAIRAREGYMAEWQADGDGYLLIEHHCPICAAATACQGFCRAELELFRDVLSGTEVTRVDHLLAGAHRCAYRITPAASGHRSPA